jgi:drug/metabolite transporter (DMT)-like permease
VINFLPISILAYALNGGAAIIDKILINSKIQSPYVYVFYISVMGLFAVLLIPFGIQLSVYPAILSIISGIVANLALLAYFAALKNGEASVVTPIIGSLNPLFSLVLGSLFLGQLISPIQSVAFFLLILGSVILTASLWVDKVTLNRQLLLMISAGFLFALSYVLIREAFLLSNFVSGLVISRVAGGLFVLPLLLIPRTRLDILANKATKHHFANSTSLLLFSGQAMGGIAVFLMTFATSLVNPALVNSLFGVQYLTILIVALFLAHEHKKRLLDEDLTKNVLIQKILGALILSVGVFLLSK